MSSRTATETIPRVSGWMRFLRGGPGFLADRWRRIGARLYLALGIAVALTLISAAVGVYYFEQSGDLNYQVQSESVPALEASWTAARESERLRNLGLSAVAETDSGFEGLEADAVDQSLMTLQAALNEVSGVPALASDAGAVNVAAQDLADVIDGLSFNRNQLLNANQEASDYRSRLSGVATDLGDSEAISSVLRRMLQANDEAAVLALWTEFSDAYTSSTNQSEATLQTAQGVFNVRTTQLDLEARIRDSAASFEEASDNLDEVGRESSAGRPQPLIRDLGTGGR